MVLFFVLGSIYNSSSGITIGLEIGLLTKITLWSLPKVPFKTDLLMKTVWKKYSGEVGIKYHRSCLVALVFCTKLHIKLASSLRWVSQFYFLLSFERLYIICLGLEIWHTSSQLSFLQYLVSDFWYLISFKSYSPKNGTKLTCGRAFQHNFISKANIKNPEQGFLAHRFHLLKKQKECLWQGRFST